MVQDLYLELLQMEWIIANIERHATRWTYFDMCSRQVLCFTGRHPIKDLNGK